MTRSRKFVSVTLACIMVAGMVSCLKTPDYSAEEAAAIEKYLKANPTLHFEKKESGLYYLQVQEGTGAFATDGDTACVFYTARFLNGVLIGSNVANHDTLKFAVNDENYIQGFSEAVTYMNKGAKSMTIFPSSLAYGAYGYPGTPIGGYTPLLYDIELVRIIPKPAR